MKYLKEMDDWATSNKLSDYEPPKEPEIARRFSFKPEDSFYLKKKKEAYKRGSHIRIRDFINHYNRTFADLSEGDDIFDEINHLCYVYNINEDDLMEIIDGAELHGEYNIRGLEPLKQFYFEM